MCATTILVVDDESAILDMVSEILEDEGYTVQKARNGMEAVEAVDQTHPALLLLDMWMPMLDGWGVARTLHERGVDLPIVVMTATSQAARYAREIGAAGYVAKPFHIPELLGTVDRLLADH